MPSWLALYLVGWTAVLMVGLLLVAAAVRELARALREAVTQLRSDLGGLISVLEKSASRPAASAPPRTAARPVAAVDAAPQPAALPREAPVPQLAPQDIAPGLRRPPRPSGGFGSKVNE